MTILYSVHHIQNTNKIIPQPPWRAGHWATHLNVYDPNDDFYDCLCGYNRRCKAIMCPMGIPAGNVLVYSHILGLKSDISPAGQPSKPTEQPGESRNQNHSKREPEPEPEHESEPDGSSNDGRYNDGTPNDGRYNDGSSNDGCSNDGSSNDSSSNDGISNDGSSNDSGSNDSSSNDGLSAT